MQSLLTKKHLFLIVSLFLVTRSLFIGNDISNSDAVRWHTRSEKFLTAIKNGNLKDTYQRYHPGVTLMWVNSIVKFTTFKTQLVVTNSPKTLENYDYYPIIHGISKLALIAILSCLLVIQLILAEKIFSYKAAVIYGLLVCFEPYLTGIDRWFHLTSLEAYLVFTAFLSLVVITKFYNTGKVSRSRSNLLLVSAILYALAVLTKVSALTVAPVFGLLIINIIVSTKTIRPLFIFISSFIAVVILLFPALWVIPGYVLTDIYNHLFLAVTDEIRAQYITGVKALFFYPIMLFFKLSPITLCLIPLAVFKVFKDKSLNLLYCLGYIFIVLFFLTLSDQKIDRYLITFILPLLLLCAYFISTLNIKSQIYVFALVFCKFIFVTVVYFPVYSAYINPIFGGSESLIKLGLYDNSGEYFAQAAFYLNNYGRNTIVQVPNNIDSFKYYFGGKTVTDYDSNVQFVVQSLDITRTTLTNENCFILEKAFGPRDGSNLVFIYKCAITNSDL